MKTQFKRTGVRSATALLGALAMASMAPQAVAAERADADPATQAGCPMNLHTPTRPGPGTGPIEATAQRHLGCHNAHVELIIYENITWFPDEKEAYASSYFAVGGITARGDGSDKVNSSTHYAILKVNGEQILRSKGIQ